MIGFVLMDFASAVLLSAGAKQNPHLFPLKRVHDKRGR